MSYYRNRPRRATLGEWTSANPVLAYGEQGIVTPDTGTGTGKVKIKYGDGVTPFNSLPYGYNEDELSPSVILETAGGTATAITLSDFNLVNGNAKTFIIASNNGGAATTVNGKSLYKPNSTTSPILVSGEAASIWYDLSDNCCYVDIPGVLSVSDGGTGATTAAAARTNLGAAPLAAPAFTGIPTAPTAAVDTNTTQIATTAFVVAQAGASAPLMAGTGTVGTSKRYARDDHKHPTDTTKAPLVSPAFTGTPTAPVGTDYSVSRLRGISAGTADLTAGITGLSSGSIYIVYE